MQYVKIGLIGCVLAFSTAAGGADVRQLQTLLQSAASGDESAASDEESFGDYENIRTATREQIEPLLPLAQQCLHSPKRPIQGVGLSLFFGIIARRPLESAKLIEPYLDDLNSLLDAPDQSMRNFTLYIIALIFPKPPPKALAYLEARLNDKKTAEEQAGAIAVVLLSSGDPALMSEALRFAEARPQLKVDMIQTIGLKQIVTEEALKALHWAFQDPKFYQEAVDAVGRLPRDVSKGFAQDLAHVMEDPNTDPRVVESARQALTR
jgi:hypothetical protein